MTTSAIKQFEIPSEMRVVATRSVEAASTLEARVEGSQLAAEQISKMALNFAMRDTLSAFEFAQKIIRLRCRRVPQIAY